MHQRGIVLTNTAHLMHNHAQNNNCMDQISSCFQVQKNGLHLNLFY